MVGFVAEDEFTRAQDDPVFRISLMARSLDRLVSALERFRNLHPEPDTQQSAQIREGVRLAVELADRLKKGEREAGTQAA